MGLFDFRDFYCSNCYRNADAYFFLLFDFASTIGLRASFGLLTSLLGDHLTSIGDFFVLKSSVIEPGDSLQYFHIALSAFLSALLAFCFKKSLETWFHTVDRRMIGTIGTLILFTYYIIIFYTRFLVKHLMS